MKTVKIGMLQMAVRFSDMEKNLMTASRLVREAKEKGAEICVLPECADLGWANPEAPLLAAPVPGQVSDVYRALAMEHRVYLAAGLTERDGEKLYNTALLISDKGEILLKHRKINVLTGVEDLYGIGDRLAVAETEFGKIGIAICADNLTESLSIGETLGRMGAALLLSPSAWAVKPDRDPVREPYGEEWHRPYRYLSKNLYMAVIGVSNVGAVSAGAWAGWKAIGNSIAYDSDGRLLTVLPYGESAETVEVVEVHLPKEKEQGTMLAETLYKNRAQKP